MMLKRICLILIFYLLTVGPAVARSTSADILSLEVENNSALEHYEQGLQYFERNQLPEALRHWQQAADAGHAEALYQLGFLYFDGEAVPQDYIRTAALWQQAGKAGFEPAAYSLGSFYLHGFDGAPDYDQALTWYRIAYELGSAQAAFDLGIMYREGLGVSQAFDTGLAWLEKAAERGSPDAKYVLGLMYFNADNVAGDYAKAFGYFQELEDYDIPDVQYFLGRMYRAGLGASRPDLAKARECYQSAALQNHGPAQYDLAEIYYLAEGLESVDLANAYLWYILAADNDLAAAAEQAELCEQALSPAEMGLSQVRLAPAYFFGYGAVQDRVRAYTHLLLAGFFGEDVANMLGSLGSLNAAERLQGEQAAADWLAARGVDVKF